MEAEDDADAGAGHGDGDGDGDGGGGGGGVGGGGGRGGDGGAAGGAGGAVGAAAGGGDDDDEQEDGDRQARGRALVPKESTHFPVAIPKQFSKSTLLQHSSSIRHERPVNYDANGFSLLAQLLAGQWPRRARAPSICCVGFQGYWQWP